jgi:general L-amino acid transport system substrate-binding protein
MWQRELSLLRRRRERRAGRLRYARSARQLDGFDVDYCRALASAIFNDPTKVKFVPLTAQNRFTALQSGEVDVLARNTTWTMSRDTTLGLDFAAVNYYDGQGLRFRKGGTRQAYDSNLFR